MVKPEWMVKLEFADGFQLSFAYLVPFFGLFPHIFFFNHCFHFLVNKTTRKQGFFNAAGTFSNKINLYFNKVHKQQTPTTAATTTMLQRPHHQNCRTHIPSWNWRIERKNVRLPRRMEKQRPTTDIIRQNNENLYCRLISAVFYIFFCCVYFFLFFFSILFPLYLCIVSCRQSHSFRAYVRANFSCLTEETPKI